MDRRKSLKLLAAGAVAVPAAIAGCKTGDEKSATENKAAGTGFNLDRNADELKYEKELQAKPAFFDAHEMTTLGILADIIIPKDEVSGSATDAGVPAFIEFIVKDMPQHQVPMKGGLRWLDMHCLKQFEKTFKDCTPEQRIQVVDAIAYPEIKYTDETGKEVVRGKKAKPGMEQGVSFFSLMRNLTVTGFYTSEIGVKDLGYAGNQPNKWNGVPDEVLKQYSVAYTEKELKECISFDNK